MIIYNNKEYNRAIVIGDIHGCIKELCTLLASTELKANIVTDLIISVGDLVDRGEDSKGVIDLLRQFNVVTVKGNHDDKWVRHKTNEMRELLEPGYKNKMRRMHPHNKEQFDKLEQKDFDWLKALPDSIKFRAADQDYYVVHGGFMGQSNPETQDPKITCRLRYVDKDTGMMKSNREDFTKAPPDSVYWTEKWTRPERVIYGHEARDEVNINNGCYGIDTGCVYGNKLTAMIIDSGNNITYKSVPAMKKYWSKEPGLHD